MRDLPAPPGREWGERIAAEAREWIGTPFRWEASLKGTGCDCRGLLSGVARALGRPEACALEANVVGYSRRIDEAALFAGLDRLFLRRSGEPEAGDVLAFRIGRPAKVQHLGIMAPHGRFVHAYSFDPAQVLETPLAGLWQARLAGVWGWKNLITPSGAGRAASAPLGFRPATGDGRSALRPGDAEPGLSI